MVGGIATLLAFQLAGDFISHALNLPVPGPVIGLVLLFGWLLARHGGAGEPPAPLAATSNALLGNLGLLFVPAGVGVIIYGPLLAREWAPIALAVVGGTMIAIGVTGRLAQALLGRAG